MKSVRERQGLSYLRDSKYYITVENNQFAVMRQHTIPQLFKSPYDRWNTVIKAHSSSSEPGPIMTFLNQEISIIRKNSIVIRYRMCCKMYFDHFFNKFVLSDIIHDVIALLLRL